MAFRYFTSLKLYILYIYIHCIVFKSIAKMSILSKKKPGGLQSMGSQMTGQDLMTLSRQVDTQGLHMNENRLGDLQKFLLETLGSLEKIREASSKQF